MNFSQGSSKTLADESPTRNDSNKEKTFAVAPFVWKLFNQVNRSVHKFMDINGSRDSTYPAIFLPKTWTLGRFILELEKGIQSALAPHR